jgi:methylglutaconyl-CoA hydratase
MKFNRLLYEVADGKGRIVLNRPEKRNALDDTLVSELTTALIDAESDDKVRVVQISANGATFCAGADLEYLARMATFSLEDNVKDSMSLARMLLTIYRLRKPVIAVVNGPALAGGCGLATACDFILASRENARFGYPEVKVGFVAAVVLAFLIKRVGEGRARELLLLGHTLTADEAATMGLVSRVVPESQLLPALDQLANELIATNSPTAMSLTKRLLSEIGDKHLEDSLALAASANAEARMTEDWKRGVSAFLRKEKVRW